MPPLIKRYTSQILNALEAIHKAGYIHGDLKPANILFDDQHRVKVADFGMAETMEQPLPRLVLYSRSYHPSEILLRTATRTSAADIWALGAILADMIGRRVAFTGTASEVCKIDVSELSTESAGIVGGRILEVIEHVRVVIFVVKIIVVLRLGQLVADPLGLSKEGPPHRRSGKRDIILLLQWIRAQNADEVVARMRGQKRYRSAANHDAIMDGAVRRQFAVIAQFQQPLAPFPFSTPSKLGIRRLRALRPWLAPLSGRASERIYDHDLLKTISQDQDFVYNALPPVGMLDPADRHCVMTLSASEPFPTFITVRDTLVGHLLAETGLWEVGFYIRSYTSQRHKIGYQLVLQSLVLHGKATLQALVSPNVIREMTLS
ncbi:TFIIH complex serine/threonine-protein kinase subunit kin28 [Tilletia horrida]|uniref:TFIIH complex serine/threonine-protein kinase subunit kin28 n=1 Tax=Tilletia horrida TaxID=155126 RepID=A0AAN6JJP7_9BASI|nr:TFIIH complex serine/threonine-protein kinase subunit kin28 [Tilletia horrida]